jgi:hypothetical protein
MAVNMKIAVIWDVMSDTLLEIVNSEGGGSMLP